MPCILDVRLLDSSRLIHSARLSSGSKSNAPLSRRYAILCWLQPYNPLDWLEVFIQRAPSRFRNRQKQATLSITTLSRSSLRLAWPTIMEVVPSKITSCFGLDPPPFHRFFHRHVSGFLMAMNTNQSRPCRSDDPLFEPCPSLPESSSSPFWPPFHHREFSSKMSTRPCPPNHSTFFRTLCSTLNST